MTPSRSPSLAARAMPNLLVAAIVALVTAAMSVYVGHLLTEQRVQYIESGMQKQDRERTIERAELAAKLELISQRQTAAERKLDYISGKLEASR